MKISQQQLIFSLIEKEIDKYSVKTRSPIAQLYADGKVEELEKTLSAFRELIDDHD
tara:strand:- start:63 stop:230 length:168 start_codon:yes stop_codon:yes gene_type:complete